LVKAPAASRQFGFFGDQNGEAVADGKAQGAALADEPIVFQREPGVAWVQGAAEDVEEFRGNHRVVL